MKKPAQTRCSAKAHLVMSLLGALVGSLFLWTAQPAQADSAKEPMSFTDVMEKLEQEEKTEIECGVSLLYVAYEGETEEPLHETEVLNMGKTKITTAALQSGIKKVELVETLGDGVDGTAYNYVLVYKVLPQKKAYTMMRALMEEGMHGQVKNGEPCRGSRRR